MGCIPVMLTETLDGVKIAQPLEERLKWDSFSVQVRLDEIPRLHKILGAISPARRVRMRVMMSRNWQRFLYTNMYGSYLGESGEMDAFETMIEVLRGRMYNW